MTADRVAICYRCPHCGEQDIRIVAYADRHDEMWLVKFRACSEAFWWSVDDDDDDAKEGQT